MAQLYFKACCQITDDKYILVLSKILNKVILKQIENAIPNTIKKLTDYLYGQKEDSRI